MCELIYNFCYRTSCICEANNVKKLTNVIMGPGTDVMPVGVQRALVDKFKV